MTALHWFYLAGETLVMHADLFTSLCMYESTYVCMPLCMYVYIH